MWDALSEFFAGSGLIDLVLVVTVLEMLFLELWLRRTGRAARLGQIRLMLMPGLWLMLAVRSVSLHQAWPITAGFLMAAGLAHVADLMRRLYPAES